jgi:hypothetical protein
MTYGWAIALVVIIAAVLFALGVFNVSNFIGNKAAGFSQVGVAGWQVSSGGNLSIKLTNEEGNPINITQLIVSVGTLNASINNVTGAGLPTVLSNGATSVQLNTTATALGAQTGSYTALVTIYYTDVNTGFPYVTTGTLTGTAAG